MEGWNLRSKFKQEEELWAVNSKMKGLGITISIDLNTLLEVSLLEFLLTERLILQHYIQVFID